MEGGDLATNAIVTPGAAAQLASQSAIGGDSSATSAASGANGQATFGQQQLFRQQLSMIESMAHNLADEALNEALEAYLRRQVQETADETVRAAFAAATGGGSGGQRASYQQHQDEAGEPNSESGSVSTRGEQRAASQGLADDEMSSDDGEDGYGEHGDSDSDDNGDDDTLNAHLQVDNRSNRTSTSTNSEPSDPLRQSSSPSRLDGRDIFQDLSEMSNYADRIDSILEQTASEHSTRSGSHLGGPSGGSGARRPRSVSPFMGNDDYRAAGVAQDEDDDDNDLDDRNEEVD